jgi:succinate dehydrogenase flavin-adding protein (antitoxin of CptAB toxin-antitoxin module)
MAAIDAAVNIASEDAKDILGALLDSDDQDIVDAVHEALSMLDAMDECDFDD